jgi:soluble lytic murein transglycosylase-like protein
LLLKPLETMAVQLGLASSSDPGLGIRHAGDRRHSDRRGGERDTADRRRSVRRRAKLRGLLFSALALMLPHQAKLAMPRVMTGPRVSTTVNSFIAVPPLHAYDAIIGEAAAIYAVDAALIRSVVQAESAFDPSALSRAGAMGLMQLMPETAEAFGVANPFDPRENIMAGTRLLKDLLTQYRGNIPLTLAGYNAGSGVVARYGGHVPPFKETKNYVKRITSLIADARNSGND